MRSLPSERPPVFGDGHAALRIADAVGALLAELRAVTT